VPERSEGTNRHSTLAALTERTEGTLEHSTSDHGADEGGTLPIGGTLAKARREAGLTVTQVADRTRIRETVINAIERDDYTLCGGNFYTRGHIRSIARVSGLDPEPLIGEYDEAHGGSPQAIPARQAFEPETPVRFRERRAPNWSAAMVVALVLVAIYGIVRVAVGHDEHHAKRAAAPASAKPATRPSQSAAAGEEARQDGTS
jgi:cytoskeletal protein RodZ